MVRYSAMKPQWSGVFPAVTTQFKKDQSLDLEGTARHLEALIESGVSGLVLLGSLGENTALEPDEKRRVIEMGIRVAKGRVPVLSGVAECTTAAACRYVRDIQGLGANGFMVMPAMIYRADAREAMPSPSCSTFLLNARRLPASTAWTPTTTGPSRSPTLCIS